MMIRCDRLGHNCCAMHFRCYSLNYPLLLSLGLLLFLFLPSPLDSKPSDLPTPSFPVLSSPKASTYLRWSSWRRSSRLVPTYCYTLHSTVCVRSAYVAKVCMTIIVVKGMFVSVTACTRSSLTMLTLHSSCRCTTTITLTTLPYMFHTSQKGRDQQGSQLCHSRCSKIKLTTLTCITSFAAHHPRSQQIPTSTVRGCNRAFSF